MSVDWENERVDAYASELLDLDRALEDLGRRNLRHMRVVECRFFGGMSVEETAEVLGLSAVTVMREWRSAKGWLLRALSKGER